MVGVSPTYCTCLSPLDRLPLEWFLVSFFENALSPSLLRSLYILYVYLFNPTDDPVYLVLCTC
jgi:hypothetical protein